MFWAQTTRKEFRMVTRIWHGATLAAKSDEYLNLMRTVAIPDYRSTPGNKGAYALRRMEGDTAHFLMITFWESEEAIRAFLETTSARRNTTTSTRISCSNWSRAPRITRCTTSSPHDGTRRSGAPFTGLPFVGTCRDVGE
jgi:heme-degrading monooxygenase HmoA